MEQDMRNRCWDFVLQARQAANVDEISTRFQNLVAPLGVTSSGVAIIQRPERIIADGFGLIHREWADSYKARNLQNYDPVFRSVCKRLGRYYWNDHLADMPISLEGQQVMDEAATHGLKDGYVRFLGSEQGGKFMLILQGEQLDHSPDADLLFEIAGQAFVNHGLRVVQLEEERELQRAGITDRQRDVIHRLMHGLSQEDVAQELSISRRTVEVHVKDIKNRLGARNGWEAARIALERGIFD